MSTPTRPPGVTVASDCANLICKRRGAVASALNVASRATGEFNPARTPATFSRSDFSFSICDQACMAKAESRIATCTFGSSFASTRLSIAVISVPGK